MANNKFKKEMAKAEDIITLACEKAVRGAAIELFSEVVRRTPVGNPSLWQGDAPAGYVGGRLRANWQAALRQPNIDEVESADPTGSSTVTRASSAINRFKLTDRSMHISNNLPYAERVEYGWSNQAPQGMMRTTVKKWKAYVDKNARENKK